MPRKDALQEITGKFRMIATARAVHHSCDLWVVFEPRQCNGIDVGKFVALA